LLAVRSEVTRVLESARRDKVIGNSLEAAVELYLGKELRSFLEAMAGDLAAVFIVSRVTLSELGDAPAGAQANESIPELVISVRPAGGSKCERCWMYHEDVGADAEHKTLCPRCAGVMKEI
jgi:isoleucyl-tRNA synthetase